MESLASNQVEFDLTHIKKLAAGSPVATDAFGKTYLGIECEFSTPLLIKTIDLIRYDQAAIDEFRSCVQKEITVSTLQNLHIMVVLNFRSTWLYLG